MSSSVLVRGSLYSRVTDAVAQKVRATVRGDYKTIRVFRRKKAVLLQTDLPLTESTSLAKPSGPVVVVAPLNENGPDLFNETFNGGAWYSYPVGVALFFPGNWTWTAPDLRRNQTSEKAEDELSDVMRVHELIRNAVYVMPPLDQTVFPTVYDMRMTMSPAVELTGENVGNFNCSGFVFTYLSAEQRIS